MDSLTTGRILIKITKLLALVYHRVFSYNLTRFIAIGSVGFITNLVVLFVVFDIFKVPIVVSQLIGAEFALLATFAGNNFWSFRDHHHIPIRTKLIKYHVTSGLGIAITSTMVIMLVKYAELHYGVSLVLAALVGMIWNFTFNSLLIFKSKKDKPASEPWYLAK